MWPLAILISGDNSLLDFHITQLCEIIQWTWTTQPTNDLSSIDAVHLEHYSLGTKHVQAV